MKLLWQVLARRRDFRLVLSAGLVSLTGDWVLRTGLAYYVYVLTGSTLASGAMMLASFVPQILLGSLAGVFVDRWDRRRTMIGTNLLHAVGLLPLLAVRDAGDLWIVYAVVLFQACLQQFFVPAEQSLLPELVGTDELVTANALNGQNRDVARLVGAGLGGFVAGAGGLAALAVLDAVTFTVAAVLLYRVHARQVRRTGAGGGAGDRVRELGREWREGLATCLGAPALRLLFVVAIVTSLGEGAMSTLFAPFVSSVLGADGVTYGLIVSVQAIGGLAGGFAAAAIGHRFSPALLLGVGAIAFGGIDLALFCYPLASGATWPAYVCMIVVGLPGALLVAGFMTLLQRGTTPAARGRAFGALIAAEGGATLVGIGAAGVLGDRVGIVTVLVFQGLGYVVAGAAVLLRRRTFDSGTTAGGAAVSPKPAPSPASPPAPAGPAPAGPAPAGQTGPVPERTRVGAG